MKAFRESQYHRHCLPPIQPSRYDPTRSDLSEDDQVERWLLELTDEEFESLTESKVQITQDAPTKTGDATVDQWEREFWEREKWRNNQAN